MKLARKVRKFSRIAAADDHPQGRRIGDMLEDPYSLMTMPPAVVSSPSSSPSRSTFTESHLQLPSSSLKRAATMRSSTDVPAQGAQGIQRARSPVSPIIFARPNGSHSSLSETSSALYSESRVPSRSPSLLRSEIKEVDDESPFSEAPTADAVSGSGAHSSGAQGDDVAIPTHLRDAERSRIDLPLRTASLRRVMRPRTPTKRRLSLDLRSFSPEPVKGAKLKKGKSALVSSSKKSAEEERKRSTDEMEDALDDETLRVAGSLSDKERALYLKRTRKILQLFGDKPPKEFFQVTQATRPGDDTLDAIDTISILTTVSENRRDSRATFTSLTSSTISLTVHRRVRDSVQSISEPSSPLAFTGSELPEDKKQSQEQEKRKSQSSAQDAIEEHATEASSHTEPESSGAARKSESSLEEGDLPPLPLSPMQPIHQPRPKPSIQSISAASTTSHTRTLSFHSQAPLNPHGHAHEPEPPLPAPPRTPPPGADGQVTNAVSVSMRRPTFTQGLILGQFSILFLLVLVLKYLFFDTVSDHAYRTSSYQPKIERDEDEDGIALVAERLAPKPAQDGKQSGNECESADWLNALLIQVLEAYRVKLRDGLPGAEGDEVARKRVERFANQMRPPGFL
ncbi:predicted protein, partial [Postia placenta Mad-698-R]